MMNLDLEAGKNDNDNSDSRTKGNTARNVLKMIKRQSEQVIKSN
nr:hypothetical protein [Mycoplasmopsis bovis]